jgi:hypothetical protein
MSGYDRVPSPAQAIRNRAVERFKRAYNELREETFVGKVGGGEVKFTKHKPYGGLGAIETEEGRKEAMSDFDTAIAEQNFARKMFPEAKTVGEALAKWYATDMGKKVSASFEVSCGDSNDSGGKTKSGRGYGGGRTGADLSALRYPSTFVRRVDMTKAACELLVKVPAQQMLRLRSAAQHRNMSAEQLATQLVIAPIVRGSVDKSLMQFHAWQLNNTADAGRGKKKKRKSDLKDRIGA